MLLVIIEIIDEQVMTSNIKEIKDKYLKKTSMNFQWYTLFNWKNNAHTSLHLRIYVEIAKIQSEQFQSYMVFSFL